METIKSDEYIEKNQPFAIVPADKVKGDTYPVHKHEFIELVFVTSGKSTHFVDEIPIEVNDGEVLLIDYNQSHSYYVNDDMKYYDLLIKPEYISSKLSDAQSIYDVFSFFVLNKYFSEEKNHIPIIRLSAVQKLELESFAEKMVAESKNKSPGYELAIDGYMRLILSRLIFVLKEDENHKIISDITQELLEYIDANYTKKITLSELSKKCFYNPAYLGRLFKNTLNISLHEYITEKRIDYAKGLLCSSDKTVEKIAELSGYENKKQFHTVFKQKTGLTPMQYRMENKT